MLETLFYIVLAFVAALAIALTCDLSGLLMLFFPGFSSHKSYKTAAMGLTKSGTGLAKADFKASEDPPGWVGKVRVDGELWNAISDGVNGPPIEGDTVTILNVEGLTLRVERLEPTTLPA